MIDAAVQQELSAVLGDDVQFDVPLARHLALRVGGPADALATPRDRPALAQLLALCSRHGLPRFVLGSGFNTLVLDGGVDGVVIRLDHLKRLEERPGFCVRAEAGVSHASLTRFCTQRGFAGLEFGAGIPGTIGGWIAMNAGIGVREAKDVVREVEVMSPTGRRISHLGRDDLAFTYRALRGLAPGSILLSALFGVTLSDPSSVKARVDALLAQRRRTQPLDLPSCGSVFKNPRGGYAGQLIESAGLKGRRVGGAEISTLHANFIVNRGDARARDVLALIRCAESRVRARTGIRLEPEVRIVGRG